ncbi:recombinase family protein [Myceligenerans halotolerans]
MSQRLAKVDPIYLVYLRISQDRDETRRSITNQKREVDGLTHRLGIEPDGEPFIDNDISATRSKKRDGYNDLVRTIKSADRPVVIIVWAVDRLYRRPKELEALIELVENGPISILTVVSGAFDLNTPAGRAFARQMVSFAAFEGEMKADRQRAANADLAAEGAWHGSRRFGYQLNGDGSADLDIIEAPVVRALADRFLAGETIYSLTKWLNSTGVKPIRAQRWHGTSVRQLLAAPRIAGLRAYAPREHGVTDSIFRDGGQMTRGRWPGIITIAEREQIATILSDPARRLTRAGENLLSGLASCGRCGAGLVIASSGKKRRRYVCKKNTAFPERGGLSIEAESLERVIGEAAISVLSATRPPPRPESDSAPLWEAVATARRWVEDLASMLGSGELALDEYRPARDAARAQVAEAERNLNATARDAVLSSLPLGDPAGVRSWWASASTGRRRAVLEAIIDSLVILLAKGPSRTLDLDRVQITWRA